MNKELFIIGLMILTGINAIANIILGATGSERVRDNYGMFEVVVGFSMLLFLIIVIID